MKRRTTDNFTVDTSRGRFSVIDGQAYCFSDFTGRAPAGYSLVLAMTELCKARVVCERLEQWVQVAERRRAATEAMRHHNPVCDRDDI